MKNDAHPLYGPATPWGDARNVLVVRLDNMGDVLMTTPAIAAVKHHAPGMRVTLLCSRSGAALRRHLPVVDEIIEYGAPWMKGTRRGALNDRRLISRLSRAEFDAAVIFTVCTQSALPAALLCRLAGIPLRVAHSRENPYDLLTDWVPDREVCADGMRHEVTRQLDLVRSVGFTPLSDRLVFNCVPMDLHSMRRKLVRAGGDLSRRFIVIHPGATAASRRYPAERFGAAADAIARHSGCQIVFTGGADELSLVAAARQQMRQPGISLAGDLTLGELAALVESAALIICNNSGPAHIAAALGTPVVVLYAMTNPQHTPWQAKGRVLNESVPCRHCLKSECPELHHDCLLRVTPETVARAALELLLGEAPATEPMWLSPSLQA
jgi:lipopolysaccharide heptosyltransferase II